MDLSTITKQAEIEGEKFLPFVEYLIEKYDFSKKPECKTWLIKDKYVRYLGGFCHSQKIQNVAEIGTMYGNSAIGLSLSDFVDEVHTYDIDHSNIVNEEIFNNRDIHPIILETVDSYLDIPIEKYELIFVDIGIHTGKEEQLFHEKLILEEYDGWVFYDDVGPMWPGMIPFWESITQDKILLDWHSSGFGLVRYD